MYNLKRMTSFKVTVSFCRSWIELKMEVS